MGRRIPIETRLEAKIEKTADCWFWIGLLTHNGYGQFVYREGGNIKCTMAHRATYRVFVGPIPSGMTLDHLCENRSCVNPEHLEAVTLGENIRRSNRATSNTCKYGHEYKKQSKFYQRLGARRCHECHAIKESQRRVALSLSKI